MIKQISIKTKFGWISAFEKKGKGRSSKLNSEKPKLMER